MPTGARVHVYGDWDGSGVKKAQQDLSFFEKQSGAFSSSFSKSMLGVGAAFGGAFAVGNLISNVTDYLQSAATAAMEDEKSVRALSQAMKNVGMEAFAGEAEKVVSALSKQYAIADDDLRPALQTLVTATGDLSKAQDLLQTSLDVSAATGKDLTTVSLALSKASNGNIGALTRLGIPLDANIVKSKDFAAALEVVNKRFGGQAAAAADTYAGQLKSVQIAAAEAQETIGYALLDAIGNVSDALGGTGGAAGAFESFGTTVSNLITAVGDLGTQIANFTALVTNSTSSGNDFGDTVRNIGLFLSATFPPLAGLIIPMEQFIDAGERSAAQTEEFKTALEGWTALANGYTNAIDPAVVEQRKLELSAEDAKQALDELKAAVRGVTDELNRSQSMDDFRFKLANLDEDIAKNSRSFDGMGEAAKKNRDTLRDALGDASKIAQDFAGEGEGAADRFEAKYGQLGSKVVRQFVDQGFKKKDIREFLKDEGLWTAELQRILDGVDVNDESQKLGYLIGMDLTRGVVKGLGDGTPAVRNQAARLAREAEQAARDESQTQSPSKKWAALGKDLSDGLVEGIKAGGEDVRAALQESFNQWFTDSKDKLKKDLDDAKAAFRDFKSEVSGAIASAIDFRGAQDMTTVNAAGEEVGMSFLEGLRAQAQQAKGFADQVKTLITMNLSKEALQQVLDAGVTAGSSIAAELIAGGATAITETNQLVQSTQDAADEVGLQAAQNWYGAGVSSAQATYDGFKAMFGKGGEGRKALNDVMDNLANSMKRETTVTVTTINRMVTETVGSRLPGRAVGGPVSAGNAYMVGERGPEMLVMGNTSGYVVPNSGLRSSGGGGNSYNITVQAGVGDPRQIGQQVVEYIKRFEKANGQVFAAA